LRRPLTDSSGRRASKANIRDTLALQSSVARTIAGQIRATLDGREQAALDKSKAVNPEAYEAYLKGRYFLNKRTGDGLSKAIAYLAARLKSEITREQIIVRVDGGVTVFASK
jgi:hypothetical protein